MNTLRQSLAFSLLVSFVTTAFAATRYVNVNSTNAAPPYTNWVTAANVIQDAVDVADPGDQIFVTNGVYQTGGGVVYGSLTNRVAVTKPLTVQSVNGPLVTVIKGYQVPGATNGDSAVRCAYLTNGAMLIGFTLTNGATRSGGDITHEMSGAGVWCESTNAALSQCVLAGNATIAFGWGVGGGAANGTLNDCAFIGNVALAGGGAYNCVLNNCMLTDNAALSSGGGGAYLGTLNNCLIGGNSAKSGGGASGCTLNDCIFTNNLASLNGGGAHSGTLINCTLTENMATNGGGASFSTLNNCTLSVNSALNLGGGSYNCTMSNCTLMGNSALHGGGATRPSGSVIF